jgi:hypothetical protein
VSISSIQPGQFSHRNVDQTPTPAAANSGPATPARKPTPAATPASPPPTTSSSASSIAATIQAAAAAAASATSSAKTVNANLVDKKV